MGTVQFNFRESVDELSFLPSSDVDAYTIRGGKITICYFSLGKLGNRCRTDFRIDFLFFSFVSPYFFITSPIHKTSSWLIGLLGRLKHRREDWRYFFPERILFLLLFLLPVSLFPTRKFRAETGKGDVPRNSDCRTTKQHVLQHLTDSSNTVSNELLFHSVLKATFFTRRKETPKKSPFYKIVSSHLESSIATEGKVKRVILWRPRGKKSEGRKREEWIHERKRRGKSKTHVVPPFMKNMLDVWNVFSYPRLQFIAGSFGLKK